MEIIKGGEEMFKKPSYQSSLTALRAMEGLDKTAPSIYETLEKSFLSVHLPKVKITEVEAALSKNENEIPSVKEDIEKYGKRYDDQSNEDNKRKQDLAIKRKEQLEDEQHYLEKLRQILLETNESEEDKKSA